MLFLFCVCHAFASVNCCLAVTCWERPDLLALVCDVNCVFVTFPCFIMGQVWYLIVSICSLPLFNLMLELPVNILQSCQDISAWLTQ